MSPKRGPFWAPKWGEEDNATSERVTLPRLFDAILWLLFLIASVSSAEVPVKAFVLDFSDAYWQIPLRDDERIFFCAAAKVKGEKEVSRLSSSSTGQRQCRPPLGKVGGIDHASHTIALPVIGIKLDVLR